MVRLCPCVFVHSSSDDESIFRELTNTRHHEIKLRRQASLVDVDRHVSMRKGPERRRIRTYSSTNLVPSAAASASLVIPSFKITHSRSLVSTNSGSSFKTTVKRAARDGDEDDRTSTRGLDVDATTSRNVPGRFVRLVMFLFVFVFIVVLGSSSSFPPGRTSCRNRDTGVGVAVVVVPESRARGRRRRRRRRHVCHEKLLLLLFFSPTFFCPFFRNKNHSKNRPKK